MRVMRSGLILFLCFPATLLFAHCSDDTTNPDKDSGLCAADEECALGWYCDDGVCRQADLTCDDTHPCPAGQECRNGGCVAEPSDGGVDGDGGDGGDGGEPEPEPDIEIVEPPLTGDPPIHQLNFGNVMVGMTASRQVQVANVGDANLQILQLNFEACLGIEDFSVPADQLAALPVAVPPGGNTVFDVNYTASDGLTDHCILDIVSNDPDEALVKVHLLSEFKGDALAAVQPQTLNFGDIPVTETSQPLTFTVSNQGTGNAVLTVEGIRFGILSNPDFSMTIYDSGGQPAVIPALLNNGDFLDVEVVYHPQLEEQDSDEAIISTDDPVNPTLRVSLTGQGVVGILDISPSPINVGRVRVGEHGEAVVTITNAGGAPTALAEVYLWDAGPELSVTSTDLDLPNLPTNPHQLAPGASVELSVNFDPIDVGVEEASLIVENTTEEWYRVIAVTAEGYMPASVETDPPGFPVVLDFGDVQFDFNTGLVERKNLQVLIKSVGQETLQINNIQTTPLTGAEYSYEPSTIPPIAVGMAVPLNVYFEPVDVGPEGGEILVDTNDPDIAYDAVTGRFLIQMNARGIDPNIVVTPATTMNFGDVYVGKPDLRPVSIRNVGQGRLVIQSIEMTPGSSTNFSLLNLPVLPTNLDSPAQELLFDIQYLPDNLGTDNGAIQINCSDIGSPSIVLTLIGTGAGCPPNTIDCNGDPMDECETPCVFHGGELCNTFDDDCDCLIDEDFNLNSDINNCGTCGNVCPSGTGTPICNNGQCEISQCGPGLADCDTDPTDCETNINNDPNNCGSCDFACGSNAVCTSGACTCNSTWADCDSDWANGCETQLGFLPNCSACGDDCAYDNASGICSSFNCQMDACDVGWGDCNSNDTDGCETDITSTVDHCGACDDPCGDTTCGCPSPDPPSTTCCHVAAWLCAVSSCGIQTCQAEYIDLDGLVSTGCECLTDQVSDICDDSPSSDKGSLVSGVQIEISGSLYPSGDEDWYTFTARDNHGADTVSLTDNYYVHVWFKPGDGNPDGLYAFGVYRSETGTNCATKGNTPVCASDVTYEHDSGQNPCRTSGMNTSPGPPECHDDTAQYWLRVFRTGGTVNCKPYRIYVYFME